MTGNATAGKVQTQEDEATAFAIALLVPAKFIRADVAFLAQPLQESDVKALARKYQVSVQLMTMRLLALHVQLDPAGGR